MDVITAAYKALEPITEHGVKVQEGWYDERYKRLHVTLWPWLKRRRHTATTRWRSRQPGYR